MRVTNIEVTEGTALPASVRIQALVSYDDALVDPELYWVEVPWKFGDMVSCSGSPWLLAVLPLAATLGEPVVIDGPVDPTLLAGAKGLMEAWRFWHPQLYVVPIEAGVRPIAPTFNERSSAQFFSGGVDSLFTALRHDPQDLWYPEALIYVWGFDVSLQNLGMVEERRGLLQRTADDLGRSLILSASNIREVRAGSVPWGTIAHGPAMGALGLHLEGAFARILIASTDGYRETGPWGSHVSTDHLMSTSALGFVHDGPSFTRLEKLRLLSNSPRVLENLTVCWRSQGPTNCGRCEKCLRTMIGLELCSVLDECSLFDVTGLDLRRISRIYCPGGQHGSLRLYYEELLATALESKRGDLAHAISTSMRRSDFRQAWLDKLALLGRIPFLRRYHDRLARRVLSGLTR